MSPSLEDNVDVIRRRTTVVEVDWQRWWVYTVRDGLIVRAQFFLDEGTALKAVGASSRSTTGK
jgi:ketosteroid isomerase-like protein